MKNLIFALLITPLSILGQNISIDGHLVSPDSLFKTREAKNPLDIFEFEKVTDNEYMAITWIQEDSIISHDKTLVFPLSATNQELKGCMCMIKTDSLKTKAGIMCLNKKADYREMSNQTEKDFILVNSKMFAFAIKSEDEHLFWWGL